jgi:hypothetical protein
MPVLYDGLPEPIDLELELDSRVIDWTDRGDPPRGNTVSRRRAVPPVLEIGAVGSRRGTHRRYLNRVEI